jgi:hypothetical protein
MPITIQLMSGETYSFEACTASDIISRLSGFFEREKEMISVLKRDEDGEYSALSEDVTDGELYYAFVKPIPRYYLRDQKDFFERVFAEIFDDDGESSRVSEKISILHVQLSPEGWGHVRERLIQEDCPYHMLENKKLMVQIFLDERYSIVPETILIDE